MNDDLISRQQAIDVIDKIFPADPMRNDYTQGITCGAALAMEYIKQLPSAQQETHEKRTETHACDCISRQAAIDALMKRDKELRNINWYDKPFAESECKGIDYALEIVNALPSVQPTQSNASNALKTLDCIDRQSAIDALSTPHGILYPIRTIEALPSAQPERKTGRWTKAYDGNDGHVKCTGCFMTYDWISQAQYYNYCPNCGADMRERRTDE